MKQDTGLTYRISKASGWKDMRVILPIEKEREDKFNKMEVIEISLEELKAIGQHRWLEVQDGN